MTRPWRWSGAKHTPPGVSPITAGSFRGAVLVLAAWAVLGGTGAAQPPLEAVVRIRHDYQGSVVAHGSGTIVAYRDGLALVLTCRHLMPSGPEAFTVYLPGGARRARFVAWDDHADLAALAVETGGPVPVASVACWPASGQCDKAGFPGRAGGRMVTASGPILGRTSSGSVRYGFGCSGGDSGGPIFRWDGALTGVLWGGFDNETFAVDLPAVRRFLSERCERWSEK